LKTKLSKKDAGISVLLFIINYILLLLVLFAMVSINTVDMPDVNPISFITAHVRNILTVCISLAILMMIIYAYFFFENKAVLASPKKIFEIFILFCISLLVCNVIGKFINTKARPHIFCALILGILFRRRDALFLNTVYALSMLVTNRFLVAEGLDGGFIPLVESFASLLTVYSVGAISIFVLKNIKTRLGCVMIAVIMFMPILVINLVMQLPNIDELTLSEFIYTAVYSAFDSIFSVLLFMFFLPVFETLFSELTPFRLRELTSDSAKLIKMLKQNALGTYNHSLVVAQLAEACATAIGEDSELARAAAYYHDVGKLKNPEMFAENQSDYDMHKELTPELSVDIIRSHARDGARLIEKNHLPSFFADVAVQHHGTMPIKYFYAKALKMSDGELNAGNYSYSGPTPSTKIAAIIMIADACEAATRSLPDRSPEKVEALVRSLVEERINMDQFVDCNITMRELTIVTRTVVNSLTGVYHSRVAYPKLLLSKKK